jgi:hypothetical protein
LVGDGFGHLHSRRKDVGQFAIKGIGPKMGIIGCFDQLHVHAHGVAALLHASFQDVGDAKLLCDLAQVFRRAFVMLRRWARDDPLGRRFFGYVASEFSSEFRREVKHMALVFTSVFKRQHCKLLSWCLPLPMHALGADPHKETDAAADLPRHHLGIVAARPYRVRPPAAVPRGSIRAGVAGPIRLSAAPARRANASIDFEQRCQAMGYVCRFELMVGSTFEFLCAVDVLHGLAPKRAFFR